MRKSIVDLIGLEGMKKINEEHVKVYYNLVNAQKYNDEYNKYKDIEILNIEEKLLKFDWVICEVKVKRCDYEIVEYLAIRDYGCRGSWGFEVLRSIEGYNYDVCYIDYDKEIRDYGYNSGNMNLLKDYCKLLKIIKEKANNK